MAQAKKPQQANEPTGPTTPERAFEQAREFGEQMAGQARQMGEQASEQMRQFGEPERSMSRSSRRRPRSVRMPYSANVDWLQAIAEEQRKLASSPQVSEMDWFASMLKAQADFTQQFAKMVGGMAPFGQQPQS